MGTSRPAAGDDWIGLTEATVIAGLSPSTLRRLADRGALRSFVTPGGHRRFLRQSVEGLLPVSPGDLPRVSGLGETPERLARACRRTAVPEAAHVPWIAGLHRRERVRFRDDGRRIVAALVAALDASSSSVSRRALAAAHGAAEDYGREAALAGTSAAVIVDLFIRMRRPIVAELAALARRRNLDATQTTLLLGRASEAFDELLLVMVRAHDAARLERTVEPAPAEAGARS